MAQEIQEEGGILSEDDLRRYDVEWKNATVVKLQGTKLQHYSVSPPSSGAVLGFILNVMAGYKLTPDSFSENNLSLTLHRLIEVSKFAFAGRSKLGDEKFDNFSGLSKKLASKGFAEEIRSKIDDSRTFTDTSHYGNIYEEARDGGTAHVSVYAADGSAVSLTSTINNAFGSGVRGRQTGILYNNEMNLFTGIDEEAFASNLNLSNQIKPYKIPMSSMSPSLIMDKHFNVGLITGASGGPRIITSIAAVILGSIFGNETLDVTVDRPRIHHQLFPNQVLYENWMEEKHVDDLKMRGHIMNPVIKTAVCGTIKVKNDANERKLLIEAVSDGRKGGQPEGL
ncbi:hypothetical protein HELRODRAFT_188964 [Helobdella robusta]|uniref:Gamma-glutamyltransferase n=1 Tax=Helobdella robusta TaxID=6412 RepID=T1FQI5_HELRO|nr:hypothetical protein HELRODRAFT_188964 [Helobdella robusta]ESN98956.1 hypothetical protein HELRODRAFT_188964 [Helobdella robusta]